jgi:PAS domain S-box-containing protein
MIAVEGPTYVIRYANPAFCRLVGKSKEELINQLFREAIPEGNDNRYLSTLERVFQTGKAEVLSEQQHGFQTGTYWSYSVWPILDETEKICGIMIQVTDTTESALARKRAIIANQALVTSSIRQHELTESAQELNKALLARTEAKNQFIAAISHEIRTPLNAIMGFSELLNHSELSPEDRKVYGERIKRNSNLLLRLINDILDLSKAEAGKLDVEVIEFSLPELLSDVELVMRHLADEKGLEFDFSIDGILPQKVLSDPTRIKQVLTNIIGNSIKFTAKGFVKVQVTLGKDCKLTALVTDSGKGITPEQAQKLFQPFEQGDTSTTRRFGGAGLGLNLSRRLAQLLGGNVELVESVPESGCVFRIEFQLARTEFERTGAIAVKHNTEEDIRLDGIKVLLAEDAPDNQLLVRTFLGLAGARVDTADDGEMAVTMALSHDYDIILMDIQMPKLDGYGATSQLRQLGYSVPIVALTAHAMHSEVEYCKDSGFNAHLSKPIARRDLCKMVYEVAANDSGDFAKPIRQVSCPQDTAKLN